MSLLVIMALPAVLVFSKSVPELALLVIVVIPVLPNQKCDMWQSATRKKKTRANRSQLQGARTFLTETSLAIQD